MTRKTALVAAATLAAASWASAQLRQEDTFPHRDHARVFPTCVGCHAGIETGNTADRYPDPAECRNCHDGVTEEEVSWSGPVPDPSNLAFDHGVHADSLRAASDTATCNSCHQLEGTTVRMAVGRPAPSACLQCHAHEAPEHLAGTAECSTCHVALTAVPELPIARVADFPKPASHAAEDFIATHGDIPAPAEANCLVCHAQESCERCHLNAPAVPVIASLGRDRRIATLVVGLDPEYPTPTSHTQSDWSWRHAVEAEESTASCANCHAQPSCNACHQAADAGPIEQLPTPPEDDRRGVQFADGPPRVHPSGWSTTHGAEAAATEQTCLNCHGDRLFCIDCHEGPSAPQFHLPNFRERHAAVAYNNEADCTSCHNAELFCRNCHEGSGLTSQGRLNVAFHNSQPFWLLGHGQAARRGLQSCATCHAQVDCTQCHSATGAWRINPHGPGFDPTRVGNRNRITCLRCHRTVPIPPDE